MAPDVGLLRRPPRLIQQRSTAFAVSKQWGSRWRARRQLRSRQGRAHSSNFPFRPLCSAPHARQQTVGHPFRSRFLEWLPAPYA